MPSYGKQAKGQSGDLQDFCCPRLSNSNAEGSGDPLSSSISHSHLHRLRAKGSGHRGPRLPVDVASR